MKEKAIPTIEEIKEKTVPILRRYGARKAGVFGSVVRGKMRRRSDIDLLVDLPEPIGLFAFVGLQQELQQALGRKVDLVEYETIKPHIRKRILAEEVPIL
ncbi:MAG: nucleotidyltransferase family protein [Chloroflexi bacterium]|nr:nucleotidyltransferase family protein [Chloroflexota bacterium]